MTVNGARPDATGNVAVDLSGIEELNGRVDRLGVDVSSAQSAIAERYTKSETDAKIAAAIPGDYDEVKGRVAAVEAKVPAQATAQNQLADKAFVNSSIATNTAFYISDGGRPFQGLADLESYEGALTNNDYAFVVGRDASGNTTYTRYKWNEATETWAEEYVLNNSSFTAVQWEAISSGITSGLVAKLGALPTAEALAQALAGKATKEEATLTERVYSDWDILHIPLTAQQQEGFYNESADAAQNDYAVTIRGTQLYVGQFNAALLALSSDNLRASFVSGSDYASAIWGPRRKTVATRTASQGYQLGSQDDKPLASEAEAEALRTGKADKPATFTTGNLAEFDSRGNPTDSGLYKDDVESLFFSQYYPEGNVKSSAEFTSGIKYDFDTTNRTASVKPFCNTDNPDNDNSSLAGRVVIPPFVDAQGNPHISDDGTRFKVVEVSSTVGFVGYATDLTAVIVPNTVTTIGDYAFADCTSLASVSLPAATNIAFYAFYGCTRLASVDFGATLSSVPVLDVDAFNGVPTSCKIIVPDSQYDAWIAATNWSDLVTAGYKFLRHSEWEYARKYEMDAVAKQARFEEYRLPDDCFPITYDDSGLPSGQQSRTIASNDGIRFEFVSTNNIVIPHDIASEAAGGYKYGFSMFSASTLKWRDDDAPITNLKFNGTAPTANAWPVLEKDAVFVRDTRVAKDADVLKNSGDQTLSGGLTLTDSENPSHPGHAVNIDWFGINKDGITWAAWFPNDDDDYLARFSDIIAAVQQIAPAFAARAYALNDLCSYNGVVYRCKSAYTSTSSSAKPDSDTTHWEAKKVSDLFVPWVDGNIWLNGHKCVSVGGDDAGSTQYKYGVIYHDSMYTISLPKATGVITLLQNLAPNFSTSATYALNSLCVYEGKLYRCTTAITTAESWTAAHWTEATVQDVLANLAPLASPAFTGTPTAPTPTSGDNSTKVATTAFVQGAIPYDFNDATVTLSTTTDTDDTAAVTGILARATNTATLGSTVTAATVTLPAATTGKMRDFFIALTVQGSTAPSLTWIDPATQTDADIAVGEDSLADIDTGFNVIMFSEAAGQNRWIVSVKHEEAAS